MLRLQCFINLTVWTGIALLQFASTSMQAYIMYDFLSFAYMAFKNDASIVFQWYKNKWKFNGFSMLFFLLWVFKKTACEKWIGKHGANSNFGQLSYSPLALPINASIKSMFLLLPFFRLLKVKTDSLLHAESSSYAEDS